MNNPYFGGMNMNPMQGPQLGPMQGPQLGPMQGPQLGPMQGPQMGPMQGPQMGQMRMSQMNGPGSMTAPPMPPMIGSESKSVLGEPAANNQPLQFKGSSGSSGMSSNGDNKNNGKDNQSGGGGATMVQQQQQQQAMMTAAAQNIIGAGGGGPGVMMSWANMMGMDPSMMMWGPWAMGGMMGGGGMDTGMGEMMMASQPKEIINLTGAVLYPPPPNTRIQSTRERPPGCRTSFIGGLPDTMTEELLREMFEKCGTITSLRLSKKNFAHIRFEEQDAVDKALFYSGYRIKIDDKDDKPNTGRIHVDFAHARDDQHEWEMWQRAQARENRHRERMIEDSLRPPSPPKPIHFSDHEAISLIDSLKADETFQPSIVTLITWLERGDCNRRTAGTFYSLIQSSNGHVRRLINEKTACNEELEQMKIKFRERLEAIIYQFDQIEQVFAAASKQKSWDHFTKPQRKNIESWRKQLQTVKAKHQAEFMQNSGEVEMDLSDTDETPSVSDSKRRKTKDSGSAASGNTPQTRESMISMAQEWMGASQLRDENDTLKCQLEAYKNEMEQLKQEHAATNQAKDKQVKALQFVVQGMQQQLISANENVKKLTEHLKKLKIENEMLRKKDGSKSALKVDSSNTGPSSTELTGTDEQTTVAACNDDENVASPDTADTDTLILSELKSHDNEKTMEYTGGETLPIKDARLISVVSTFLHVHPSGASIDYIWSYLNRLDIKIRTSQLDELLEKYPSVFGGEDSGVGEKRWKFVGYMAS